jgi:hypothetical protein
VTPACEGQHLVEPRPPTIGPGTGQELTLTLPIKLVDAAVCKRSDGPSRKVPLRRLPLIRLKTFICTSDASEKNYGVQRCRNAESSWRQPSSTSLIIG